MTGPGGPTGEPAQVRASYLSPPDFQRLNWACFPITEAFGHSLYLVGSVLTRADYRDVDLRLILDDDDWMKMFGQRDDDPPLSRWRLLNIAVSDFVRHQSGLRSPVDFQFQPQANADTFDGPRNPVGIPRAVPTLATTKEPADV